MREKGKALEKELSKRKHEEDALRQNEEEYRNILSSIEDGYYALSFYRLSTARLGGKPNCRLNSRLNWDVLL